MDHFKGISPQERYQNDVLNEMRKQTALLGQIAQLLQEKAEVPDVKRRGRKPNGSNHSK